MNSRRSFLFIVLLLSCFTVSYAFGNKENDKAKDSRLEKIPEIVQVTGLVRLVGSGSFPELVISNSENLWYIANEDADKLMDMQYRTVTVEGEETEMDLTAANGLIVFKRRELRNIRIIKVE